MMWAAISLSAQGIEFFHGSWEEALVEADKQDKLIFVDCYTTWCGPCKKMSREVFPDPEVGEFFNSHFINVKIDMERGEGPAFGRKYPVGAYPTLYFIKGDGEAVMSQKGARMPKDLIALGKAALSRVDFSADLRKAYEAGDRDPELILEYVKALNKTGESSLKVVNDFLRETPELDDPTTRAIIFEGCTEADSRPFALISANKRLFEGEFGADALREKLILACESTADKGIEYEYFALVEQSVELMKEHAPEHWEGFRYLAPMRYHRAMNDWAAFHEMAAEYVKKVIRKDAEQIYKLAVVIKQHFSYEPASGDFIGELLEESVKQGDSWNYAFDAARFFHEKGDAKKALKYAEESRKRAIAQDASTVPMDNLIMVIKGRQNQTITAPGSSK